MHTTTAICQTLRRENAQLDDQLSKVGLSVETYRALRFAFRAAGIVIVAAALFTPGVHADPVPTLTILAAFVLGPDVVEAWLTKRNGE